MTSSAAPAKIESLFSLRWILTTLAVLIVAGVMIRLGIWQLDRLRQRRAFNAAVEAQMATPPLNLNQPLPAQPLSGMEYRAVVVHGTFDPQNEVLLRNQISAQNEPGYHLLTPLRIDGQPTAVLVDRGFVPMTANQPGALAAYAVSGPVTVQAILRNGHVPPPMFGVPDPTLAPDQTRLPAWNATDIARIAAQTPYPLLDVYLQAQPDPQAPANAPIASIDAPDLSEGPHLGYAVQWFSFAVVLLAGYPYFVKKSRKKAAPHA